MANAPFDYISLIMIILMILPIITGFFEGGFKGIAKILSFGLAIGLAYAFYQPLAQAIASSSWGENMRAGFQQFANEHINLPIIPELGFAVTGSTPIPKIVFESAEFRNAIYDNLNLASGFREPIDSLLMQTVAEMGGLTITIADPIAIVMVKLVSTGIAFAGLVAGIFLLALIVIGIVSFVRKLLHKKIGFLNRLLGAASGFVSGFIVCWIIGLVIASLIDDRHAGPRLPSIGHRAR